MRASEAKSISKSVKKLNELKEKLSSQPSEVVTTIWRNIIEAILRGETICSTYIMSNGVRAALVNAGFVVEEVIETDIRFYTISWEEEDASKSRSKKRKNRIQ